MPTGILFLIWNITVSHWYLPMNRKPRRSKRASRNSFLSKNQNFTVIFFLGLCFLFGNFLAYFIFKNETALASLYTLGYSDLSAYTNSSMSSAFLSSSIYHLILLISATSILGIFFVPLSFSVRGFFLSFVAMSISSAYDSGGFLLALAILAPPSLFLLPTMFVLGDLSFNCSRYLLSLLTNTKAPTFMYRLDKVLFVSLLSIALAACVKAYVVTRIIELILL